MLVRAFGASAFGLRGGIRMEATQTPTHVYHAPAPASHCRVPTSRDRLEHLQPTRQEARGTDASCKGARAHSTYKVKGTGGAYVSRKEAAPLPIREPYPRPLVALSPRFRSCTGTSVLSKSPRYCTAVPPAADAPVPHTTRTPSLPALHADLLPEATTNGDDI